MSVARHTSYNIVGSLIPLAVNVVTVPLYLRQIGLERYGVLAICWVLVGYFGLFEMGLGPATAQRIAPMEEEQAERRSATVWGALLLSLLLGMTGAAVLRIFAEPILTGIRGMRAGLAGELTAALLWLAALIPLGTTYGVLSGALQGRQQFLLLNLVSSASNALMSIAPLAIAYAAGPQLTYLIPALVAAKAAAVAILFAVCWRAVPLAGPQWPSRQLLMSLASFGGWVTGAAILTPLLTSAEKFAIGWMVGAAAVSFYIVPFNLVSRVLLLPSSLASALFPRFAVMAEMERGEAERKALLWLVAVLGPAIVALIAVLQPFFRLWLGAGIAARSAPIGTVLLAGLWFNCCSYVPHARLQGSGRPDLVTKISLAQIVPYFVLLFEAIRLGGAMGAAIIWSVRAGVEMFVFFLVTGQPKQLISIIRLPTALLLSAIALALVAPWPDPAGTSGLLLIFVIATLIGVHRLRLDLAAIARRFWQSPQV